MKARRTGKADERKRSPRRDSYLSRIMTALLTTAPGLTAEEANALIGLPRNRQTFYEAVALLQGRGVKFRVDSVPGSKGYAVKRYTLIDRPTHLIYAGKVTSKGQVTIPAGVRRALGFENEAELLFEVGTDGVRLHHKRTPDPAWLKLVITKDDPSGDIPPLGTVVYLKERIRDRDRFAELTLLSTDDWDSVPGSELYLVVNEAVMDSWVVEPQWTAAA